MTEYTVGATMLALLLLVLVTGGWLMFADGSGNNPLAEHRGKLAIVVLIYILVAMTLMVFKI